MRISQETVSDIRKIFGGFFPFLLSFASAALAETKSEPVIPKIQVGLNEEDTGTVHVPRNKFHYFLGFSLPKDGHFQGASGDRFTLENDTGILAHLGYSRKFGQFRLGGLFAVESYGHKTLTGIPVIGSLTAEGHRRAIGAMLKLDWQPDFGNFLFRTELNIGTMYAMERLTLASRSLAYSRMVFAYGVGLGFGYSWTDSFQTLLRYHYLGQGEVGRFEDSKSHSFGVELSSAF